MSVREIFENRVDAGKRLATALARFRGSTPLVLGLPRGGVVVAHEVAEALHGDLDLWGVRKVLVPGRTELVLGAVAEGSELVVDHESVHASHMSPDQVRRTLLTRLREVERQCRRHRGDRPAPEIGGRVVIVVDDGVANGATARAALRAIRRRGPSHLVLAVPVARDVVLRSLAREADEIVCLERVDRLAAVGFWYREFRAVDDDSIIALLTPRHATRTVRVFRVVPAGDGWGVVEGRARVIDRQPTKEAAIREARELAGGSGAIVFVQSGSGHLDHETFAY
ncbi:MAG: phosphoribosyltransferase family protein [Polyangiales bacterium]